jgi:uncharacterized protein
MMMPTRPIAPLALTMALTLTLSACLGAPTSRYLIDPPQSTVRVRASVASVMVRDVSLPTYAAAEEISRQDADGALRDTGQGLWADQPVRGVTLALARQLAAMSTATVAAEPWPLAGVAETVLDVRVDQILAGRDGVFHLSGQYFLSGEETSLQPVAKSFDIAVPVGDAGVGAIVAAQSAAIGQLAEQIARRLAG